MRTNTKKFLCLLILLGILLTTFPQATVYAAYISNNIPIITYTLDGSVSTYDGINGKRCGSVYTNDPCTILEIYSSGWVRLRYPKDSGGEKTAYAKSEEFFSKMPSNVSLVKLGKEFTVYRRADLKEKLGTCFATDEVIILSTNGTNTQIIYPVANGFKMGWIKGNYCAYEGLTEVNIPSGYYQIKASSDRNYVIDIYGGYTDDDVAAQLYTNNGTTNQGFLILHYRDSYYIIIALHSNKALNVYQGLKHNGAKIIQYGPTFTDNELWKIYKTNDGNYCFQSKDSGLFLDIYGNYMADCNTIQLYEFNNTAAQKFYLQSVTVNGESYDASKHKIEIPEANTSSLESLIGKTIANINSTHYTSENISYKGGYKGQCTWYAYGRFYELTGIKLTSAPHAKYWLTTNSSNSRVRIMYGAGNIQPKSIAVRTSGTWGHVMIVEDVVYENGTPEWVYFTECNADGNGVYNSGKDAIVQKLSYDQFIKQKNPAGYIIAR